VVHGAIFVCTFASHNFFTVKKKILILLFLLTFPSVLYVFLSTGNTNFIHLPYFGVKELAANGKDTIYHTIKPFSFVNQDGKTITDKDFEGKIYVTDYFFTTCQTICPKMSTELQRVQSKFAYTNGLVQILSHTVDPEHDSVPVLRSYADMVHANTNTWNFVTGDKKELYEMARESYLINALEGDGGPDDFIHSEFFVLVDKEKHIRGFYDGTDIKQVNNLLDDIKVLLAEYAIKDNQNKKEKPEYRPKKK
jgi:protein SCO1/2